MLQLSLSIIVDRFTSQIFGKAYAEPPSFAYEATHPDDQAYDGFLALRGLTVDAHDKLGDGSVRFSRRTRR
jgi:hypothetical protein